MDKNRNKKGPFKQMLEELKEGNSFRFIRVGIKRCFPLAKLNPAV
jgi:hypothetical protein